MRAIQYFSDESLKRSRALTTDQIITFVENFRILHTLDATQGKSKLISIKIPENLLNAFRIHAELKGKKYQTMIKDLMLASLESRL